MILGQMYLTLNAFRSTRCPKIILGPPCAVLLPTFATAVKVSHFFFWSASRNNSCPVVSYDAYVQTIPGHVHTPARHIRTHIRTEHIKTHNVRCVLVCPKMILGQRVVLK